MVGLGPTLQACAQFRGLISNGYGIVFFAAIVPETLFTSAG